MPVQPSDEKQSGSGRCQPVVCEILGRAGRTHSSIRRCFATSQGESAFNYLLVRCSKNASEDPTTFMGPIRRRCRMYLVRKEFAEVSRTRRKDSAFHGKVLAARFAFPKPLRLCKEICGLQDLPFSLASIDGAAKN
jgi:hypothetical protein